MALDIPTRHGIHLEQAKAIASPLLWCIDDKQAAEPSQQGWLSLGNALNQGDPLADDLVRWMAAQGMSNGWKQFDLALSGDCSQSAEPIDAFMKSVKSAPKWLDHRKVERGLAVSARSGKTGMRVLRDFGLMAGYQASAINQTLVKTGALEKGAAKRVAETTKWWMDCTEPGGLSPDGAGFKTTLRVRVIHAMVRANLSRREDWNHGYYGLPINQLDMQVTYLAFSVMFLLGQRLLGVSINQQDADDVMHLWRYIGWLMGVNDSLLVCSEQEGRAALYLNLLSQATADETSKQLGRALMDEPLGRHYPNFQWLRSRWDKHVHLSIIRFFVGRRGMKALGLPIWTLPWYPLIFSPLNFLVQNTVRRLPRGNDFLAQRGRQAQAAQLRIMFGNQRPDIINESNIKAAE